MRRKRQPVILTIIVVRQNIFKIKHRGSVDNMNSGQWFHQCEYGKLVLHIHKSRKTLGLQEWWSVQIGSQEVSQSGSKKKERRGWIRGGVEIQNVCAKRGRKENMLNNSVTCRFIHSLFSGLRQDPNGCGVHLLGHVDVAAQERRGGRLWASCQNYEREEKQRWERRELNGNSVSEDVFASSRGCMSKQERILWLD